MCMENKKLYKQIDIFLRTVSKMGLTTRMISEEISVSVHSLSNWRLGKSTPNQANLLKLKDFSLALLSSGGLDLPLKKEHREPIENFYIQIESVLREMPLLGKKEEKIISDHQNNRKAQKLVKNLLAFNVFDSYLNYDDLSGFQIDKKNKIDRKIKKEYWSMFTKNFTLLINFVDEATQYELKTLRECSLIPDTLDERLLEEFYYNLPHEEDFKVTSIVSSVAELWLEKSLQVSKTQIINWKKGKDFPTEENLEKLKKIVGLTGKGAFLLYEFPEWKLLDMFLKSPELDSKQRDNEIMYFRTLEYFTNVLFFYCGKNKKMKILQQEMEDNLINDNSVTITSSFFMEMWNLKVSRELEPNDDYLELSYYFQLEDHEVEYILNKDYSILKSIFTEENIRLLKCYAQRDFDSEQQEALLELIDSLKNKEGIYNVKLVSEPKFRKLYNHRMNN